MDLRELVGRNLSRLHRKEGPLQEELKARSGFSQQYLNGIERGKCNPTVITIYEQAKTLGVSLVELLRPNDEDSSVPE